MTAPAPTAGAPGEPDRADGADGPDELAELAEPSGAADTADPGASGDVREIDVRPVPRGDRHPLVFAAYDDLRPGQSIVLVNDHEPRHLRDEFEEEFAGAFGWHALPGSSDAAGWRIRITKRAGTALPRIVVSGAHAIDTPVDAAGSVWRLRPSRRDLDSNIIVLPPGDEIRRHEGPNLDVLVFVIAGSGTLETELDAVPLEPGAVVWLPRRSQRRFVAGDGGLRYLSVHARKPGLGITARPAGA
ncbi:DUF2249 domain-containing protein [Agromyces larvae]|uniref:DUF2249 domain-containing protein n=1 Tax=Agromyces larvae TaxID=2929802 RepID=A0ABY4C6A2_9MICO|nr:DUF2249 domain-containing protein [Agromyces larvae]UOE45523.1 DUF2249 domain-containing protein [Agromyces larvae]